MGSEMCIRDSTDTLDLAQDVFIRSQNVQESPIDKLEPIAKAKIPILHVLGAADKVVPVEENSAIIEKRYRELGGNIQIISKPSVGHHPHALKDPKPIVDFIVKHCMNL